MPLFLTSTSGAVPSEYDSVTIPATYQVAFQRLLRDLKASRPEAVGPELRTTSDWMTKAR